MVSSSSRRPGIMELVARNDVDLVADARVERLRGQLLARLGIRRPSSGTAIDHGSSNCPAPTNGTKSR